MFASLAIGLYLLGLVLRNQQLVTVAVVLLSFLTYAAFRTTHADVASSGRRLEDNESDEGIQLGGISALRKVSSSRVFEDGEIDVVLRIQNRTPMAKIIEVRDRVPDHSQPRIGHSHQRMGGRLEGLGSPS